MIKIAYQVHKVHKVKKISMREFQEKNKFRNLLYSKMSIILLFVILIFIGKAVIGVYYKQKVSEERLLVAKIRMVELEEKEKSLSSEIDRLKTDKGAEEEIRRKYMVGKEGEKVIIITDNARSADGATEKNMDKKTLWSKFLDFFR